MKEAAKACIIVVLVLCGWKYIETGQDGRADRIAEETAMLADESLWENDDE